MKEFNTINVKRLILYGLTTHDLMLDWLTHYYPMNHHQSNAFIRLVNIIIS